MVFWFSVMTKIVSASFLCLAPGLLFTDESAAALAQNNASSQLLREIANTIDSRMRHLNPFLVRYTLECSETKAWEAANRRPNPADVMWTVNALFARKGQKTKSWADRQHPRTGGQPGATFVLFNGEKEIQPSNLPNEFLVRGQASNSLIVDTPLGLMGEVSLHDILQSFLTGETRIVVRSSKLTQEGNELVQFVDLFFPQSNWTTKCWLLPEKGYAVERLEIYNARHGIVERSVLLESEWVNGLSLPKRGRQQHYIADGQLGTTTSFVVNEYVFGAGDIKDNEFQFAFPKDALVFDVDRATIIRNVPAAQESLEQLVKQTGSGRTFWIGWLALFVGLTVLGMVAMILIRRKRLEPAAGSTTNRRAIR